MPLPGSIQYITVHGTFQDSGGNPCTGSITFAPPPILVDPGSSVIYSRPVSANLDATGAFSVSLVCTDNPELVPPGWSYTVTERITGSSSRAYQVFLPHTLGVSVDFSNVTPIPSVTGAPAIIPSGVVAPGYGALAYTQTWTGSNTFSGATVFTGAVTGLSTVGGVTISGTPVSGYALIAISASAATWQPQSGGTGGGIQLAGDLGGSLAVPTVTGTHLAAPLPLAQGGTGQGTAQAALTALAGAQSAGKYLRSDGTNTALATIQAGDIPTLNQSTTGTSSNITGVALVANGGTGATTAPLARTALGLGSAAVANVDTTAADIAPLGTQAAGAVGQVADAGHVHSMPRLDQLLAPNAAVGYNSQKITALAVGTLSTDAANVSQLPVAASTVTSSTTYAQASAVGASAAYARADHTHGTPSLTATAPATTLGIATAAALGSATLPALADHVHPMAAAAAPAASAVGDSVVTGVASTFSASDHKHAREAFATPGASAVGDAATAGVSTSLPRADHTHGREGFGAVTALSAFNTASANGSATTVAHSDHVHGAPALPTASTSTAGIVQLDGTATDIAALGTQAAGASGKAADAAHVHPYQAHVFSVIAQGAKGDGKISNTGATTAASSTVTIGEAVLSAADNGKVVMIKNAYNANNAAGQTTAIGVMTVVNSTTFTATFATNPTQTSTGLQVLWGTDDTVAIQAAIAAANSYAAAHGGLGEIYFPPPPGGNFYAVSGTLKTTDGTNAVYNSQLTIPVNAETNQAITLIFRGPGDAGQSRYWNTNYPTWNGCIQSFGTFATASAQSTSITGGGNPSVVGGPTGKNSYGVLQGVNTTPTYTNTCVVFQDFTILTAHSNSGWTYTAANLFGCARFHARNFTYGTNGVVQFAIYTPNLGDFTNVTLLSAGLSIGLIMPSNGNNASNYLQNVVCNGGYTFALFAMEHTVGNAVTLLYCWSGLCAVGNYADSGTNAVSALHATQWDQVCVEGCTYHVNIIGAGASALGPIIHAVLDTEGTIQIRDAVGATLANTGAGLAAALGTIRVCGSPSAITVSTGTGAGGLGTGIVIIKEQVLPGVPSSGIPALIDGTAVSNTLWRPATVYLSGGTNVTTVAVSRLMGGVNTVAVTNVISQTAAPIAANTPIRLQPGQWIKVTTSAGTLPTAVWVLD